MSSALFFIKRKRSPPHRAASLSLSLVRSRRTRRAQPVGGPRLRPCRRVQLCPIREGNPWDPVVWVNPAQPPSVSRCAPHSRSPVSLIVFFSNPARAGGDPVLVPPLVWVVCFLSWGAPTPPSSAGGPLHPFTYGSCRVPTIAVVGSLVTVWLARATHSHKLTRHSASWAAATQSRVTRVKVYGKRYSALRATPGPCRPPAPTVPRAQTTAGTAQTGDRTRDV